LIPLLRGRYVAASSVRNGPELLPARLIGTGNYWRWKVNEIAKERTGSILRIRLNRPQNKNAMTSNMYVAIAQLTYTSCCGMVRAIRSVFECQPNLHPDYYLGMKNTFLLPRLHQLFRIFNSSVAKERYEHHSGSCYHSPSLP
jgi:hypothetical protein